MFKQLLRRITAYLRNTLLREPGELISIDDDFFDLDDRNDPWRTKAYWAVYRFFANTKIFHPRLIYYDIKYFLQRGRRGWADCDTWSLDGYLDRWLPDALRHLKKTKHGVPFAMFDGLPMNDEDAEFKIAEARWDAIMDKMIAAFEANRRMSEGLYEEELGTYPLHRPDNVSKEDWKKLRDDRFAAERLLEERDKKISEEGLALFIKFYQNLWD